MREVLNGRNRIIGVALVGTALLTACGYDPTCDCFPTDKAVCNGKTVDTPANLLNTQPQEYTIPVEGPNHQKGGIIMQVGNGLASVAVTHSLTTETMQPDSPFTPTKELDTNPSFDVSTANASWHVTFERSEDNITVSGTCH